MTKKKVLALLLCICMLVGLMPTTALAADQASDQAGVRVSENSYDATTGIMKVRVQAKLPVDTGVSSLGVVLSYDNTKLSVVNKNNSNDITLSDGELKSPRDAIIIPLLNSENEYGSTAAYSIANGELYKSGDRSGLYLFLYTTEAAAAAQKTGNWFDCCEIWFRVAGNPADPSTVLNSDSLRIADAAQDDAVIKGVFPANNIYSIYLTDKSDPARIYVFGRMSGCGDSEVTGEKYLMAAAGNNTATYPGSDNTPTPPAPVDQTITADNVTATYGDTNAKITASTNGDGALSYAVKSGDDVIAVDSNGNLTIKKVGTATVTITAAATANYKEATKDVTVTVNPKKLNPINSSTGPEQTLFITYVEENFIYDGTEKKPIVRVRLESYSSDKKLTENVDYTVTYDNNTNASGTLSNPQNATFTVTAKQGSNYTWEPHTMDFVIKKATLTITADNVSAALGDTGKKIKATTNVTGCNLTYTVTSGADVIAVDTNGNLTIKKAGSAQVTISAAKNDNYETATKVVNVNITQTPLTGNVRITGETKVGKPLTVDVSDLNETTHLSYQWYRGNKKIDGANGKTYKLTKDDLGKKITVEVKTTAASTVSGSTTDTTAKEITCDHNFTGKDTAVATLVKAGTCKDKAVYRYYCVLCDTVDPDENHTFEGEKNPNKHDGDTEVRGQKDATCTEKGYTGDTYCLGCNTKTATGTDIPATGHALTYTASVVATCKVEGYRDYWQCSKCNNYYADKDAKTELSAEDVKPALNPDNHVRTEIKSIKAPTCTETGYTGDTWCLDCNTKIQNGTTIPALGHTFTTGEGDDTKPNYVPAGTGSYGITIERVKCVNCDAYDETSENAFKASLPINVSLRVQKDAASISNPPAGVQFIFSLYKEENAQMALVAFRSFMKTTGAADEILPGQYVVEQTEASEDDAIAKLRAALPSRINPWTVTQTSLDMTNWTIDRTEYKIAFVLEEETYVLRIVDDQEIVITANEPETDPTTPGGEVEPTKPVSDIVAFKNIYKAVKQDDPPTPTPAIPDGPKHTNRRYPAKPAASTDTKKPDGVTSARTFDAGVALYVGMSVLSLTGTALVIGKKKEF